MIVLKCGVDADAALTTPVLQQATLEILDTTAAVGEWVPLPGVPALATAGRVGLGTKTAQQGTMDGATGLAIGKAGTALVNKGGALLGAVVGAARKGIGLSDEAAEAAAKTATARAARLGREGEASAGIGSPKSGVEINGRMRFPDELSPTLLKEVKNVARQGWTKQLKDYADLARQRNIPFELWVRGANNPRGATALTKPLQDAVKRGDVIIRRF
jgi:hypothetical protein